MLVFQKSLNKRNRWALAICVGTVGFEPCIAAFYLGEILRLLSYDLNTLNQ